MTDKGSLEFATRTLNMILAEIDAPLYVQIKPHASWGEPSPTITYRGYPKGSVVPDELRILAFRAYWLLCHAGWTPPYKQRCCDCLLARIPASECDHEAVWR